MASILGILIRVQRYSGLHSFAVSCKFQEGNPQVMQEIILSPYNNNFFIIIIIINYFSFVFSNLCHKTVAETGLAL